LDNFTIHGVDFTFDTVANSQIVNYDWFMGALSSGSWEKETFEIFESVKDKTKTAIDIGAWIGPTSIWLSKNFKNVIAVEADRMAISALKANLESSNCNNVKIVENPVFSKSNVNLYFGCNSKIKAVLGDSTSQLKENTTDNKDFEVLTVSIHDLLKDLKDVSFIKVDIEGGEENIIPDLFEICKSNGYSLLISFHYGWWKDHNLERFEKYFNLASNEKDISKFIKSNPFGSLFLTF